MVNDTPVSVMINISAEDRVYNLLLAYIENYDKKIALGTLHLGYVLEKLSESQTIECFDLLDGEGKNSNYKASIATPNQQLISKRYFRSTALRYLFSLYDKLLRK